MVAVDAGEEKELTALYHLAVPQVSGLELICDADAMRMEPELHCSMALFSPNSGIGDVQPSAALLGEAEAHGAMVA